MIKKFLVTGSSGFIGTNFISFLDKRKISYASLDIKRNKYFLAQNFSKIDLTDQKKVNFFFKNNSFKYVVHFVAFPGIIDCDLNPEKAIQDNLISTMNILKNQKKFKKIILISSYATLDKASFSFYAACKKIIEEFSNTIIAENKIITIRLPNIYGEYSEHKKSVVHQICKSIVHQKSFLLHGDGKQKRNYVYVGDLCKIILKICISKSKKKIVNIGNKKNYSIITIMKKFNKIIGKKFLFKKINHPLNNKFTKTKKIVNTPDYLIQDQDFIKNLKKTLSWYKNYASKKS